LIDRRFKAYIPPAAVSAFEEQEIFVIFAEIAYCFAAFGIFYDRTRREIYDNVFPVAPVTAFPFTVSTVFGLETLLVTQMRKGAQVPPHGKNYIAAPAAVTA
jgi:hypothetical protein